MDEDGFDKNPGLDEKIDNDDDDDEDVNRTQP